MKRVKLFEQFVNEAKEEQIASDILQDLLNEYDPWEIQEMQAEEAEETVASYGHKGAKAKKIASILLDLAQSGTFESVVNESKEWSLKFDLGKIDPTEFKEWAGEQFQRIHKVTVKCDGTECVITGKGNDDRNGSSMEWVKDRIEKSWTIDKATFESKLYEYSREDFTAKKIDRKDAVKPNILAKILFRASKTTEEAEQRILSFNGTAMATHVAYYIVKPNGNRPDRPTYRIHVEQYYKWRPNEPKVNVSHVYILKLKDGVDWRDTEQRYTRTEDHWDVLGRAYVDTDMLTDDLNRTLEVLKKA